MPTITIDLPEELYEQLTQPVQTERRALQEEITRLAAEQVARRRVATALLPPEGQQAPDIRRTRGGRLSDEDKARLLTPLSDEEKAVRARLLEDLRRNRHTMPRLNMTIEEMNRAIEEGRP